MAHSPLSGPESSAVTEPPAVSSLEKSPSTGVVAGRNTEIIFSALEQFIAGTLNVDVVLGAIAEAAQSLTRSNGTAIALLRDGVIICRARSGDMAPALGTRLSVDAGLSGECLRTGITLRSDDTSKDHRADQELCRQLGLQSIAAVPLRHGAQTVGILEAFSSERCAFAEEKMDLLTRLARLAEAAAFKPQEELAAVTKSQQGTEAVSAGSWEPPPDKVAAPPDRAVRAERRQYYRVAAAVAAMLLLFSIVGWRIWRKPPAATTSATQPAVAPPAQSAAPAETTEILSVVVPASKPTPAHSRTESGGIPLVIASKTEGAPDKISPTETLNAGEHPSPPLARSSTNASQIASLLSTPARLPEFAAPISQGFSGGTLIRKVQPAYPRQAVPLGLKGSVRLQATVAENGTVRDLKVTSGHPVLARAAVEAVSQWRYRPFLLNGKPIRKQVDISIDFNMPESAK